MPSRTASRLWIVCIVSAACRAPDLGAHLARFEDMPAAAPRRAVEASPDGIEIGYHAGAWLGDGEPANDLPIPASLYGRFPVSPDWWVRVGVEFAAGDFETPHEILGIAQDPDEPDIDADSRYLSVLAWIERVYALSRKDELFWQVGAGLSMVDVDDVDGPVQGGGSFDIETDAGTEILGSVGGGYRRRLGRWVLEGLVRYDHHVADWELRDRASGATGEVDDYRTWAFLIGVGYSF